MNLDSSVVGKLYRRQESVCYNVFCYLTVSSLLAFSRNAAGLHMTYHCPLSVWNSKQICMAQSLYVQNLFGGGSKDGCLGGPVTQSSPKIHALTVHQTLLHVLTACLVSQDISDKGMATDSTQRLHCIAAAERVGR